MAKARDQSVHQVQPVQTQRRMSSRMTNARRAQTDLTAHLILEGACAWRLGNRTVAYEALTKCPAGRLLTKTFVIGRRRPAAVVADAIAERHRQLIEAHIEKQRSRGTAATQPIH